MKILLLGEFSGLHKNLKEGLVELGHDVTLAGRRDWFKKIPVDIDLEAKGSQIGRKIKRRVKPILKLPHLVGYDIVQLINPFYFYQKYFPTKIFYNILINNSKKFFLSAAGSDAFFWRQGRQRLEYGPYDDFLKYDNKSDYYFLNTDKAYEFNSSFIKRVDGIIPIMYEYEISYQGSEKLLKTIPIPINTREIEYEENVIDQKLIVFHGLSRYGFKGTRHVEKAFKYLSQKYPNDLELIIDGKMPLDKYLALMSKTNIVIDQLNSYSLGVNGVYALAMGKVVLGGAEPESLRSLRVEESPVFNVKPNAQSIINVIEYLLENKSMISQIGYRSRKFAEDVHGHIKVAQEYINVWKKAKDT